MPTSYPLSSPSTLSPSPLSSDGPRLPWLLRRPGAPRALRLYGFAYAGGDAGMYLSWQPALGAQIEVCGVQLPGRGVRLREPPAHTMEPLVERLAADIAAQPRQPFALFGHSLGALLAFEVARRLQRLGAPAPLHLFVSACEAPGYRREGRNLHTLPDEALIEVLRDYNGTPAEVLRDREFMALVLPTLRADFALACEYAYRPGPKLRVPMSVLVGEREREGRWSEVGRWAEQTEAGCELHRFDGGHLFVDSHRAAVVDCVRETLLRAMPAPRTQLG
ncbi:thioesterase II family protein [Lysobacter enzymogenes]|nr:alpha/beta fold hydrolase [Lysobacter enzymogenes]